MTLQFMHPSRSKLREWLSSLTPSPKVTSHVETCERCASRLVDLDDKEIDGADKASDEAVLARVVRAEWAPPADLTARVIRTIDERERNERDLNVMLGLLGVATATAALMLPPEDGVDREDHDRRDELKGPEGRNRPEDPDGGNTT